MFAGSSPGVNITSVPGKADLVVNESISEKIIRDVSNKVVEDQITLSKIKVKEMQDTYYIRNYYN